MAWLVQATPPLYYKTASGSPPAPPGPYTVTFATDVTAGNWILLPVSQWLHTTNSPTDSRSSSYTKTANRNVGDNNIELWYAQLGSSGPCTVTMTDSAGFWALNMIALEVTGITAFDATANAGGTSTTPSVTRALAQANEFVVGVLGMNASATITPTWGTEVAENETKNSGYPVSLPCNFTYREVTDGADQTPAWTLGTSVAWAASVAAFKVTPPSSGGYSGRLIRGVGRGILR